MLLIIVMEIVGAIIMGILFYNMRYDADDTFIGVILGLIVGAVLGLVSTLIISAAISSSSNYEIVSTEHIELMNQNSAYVIMINDKKNGTKYVANKKSNPASSITSCTCNTEFTYENLDSPFVTITHLEMSKKILKYISFKGTKTKYNYHVPEETIQILNLGF